MMPKVAIIYLSFHSDPHVDDAISAWKKLSYPKEDLAIVIVDNLHPKFGSSFRFIEEKINSVEKGILPNVVILPQKENLGFAGGNNVGIEWALDHGFDYIFLHNDDGFMSVNSLEPLVEAMEKDKTIGIAQSLILLHPDTEYINSAGNAYQYLGFGFCNEYRTKFFDLKLSPVSDVGYTSGAAVLLRSDLLRRYGLWDKDFFLYHEDLEYAMRLKIAGFRAVVVRDSIFFHKYQFGRSIEKFFWMERNRIGVLIMFFHLPTLLLLLPMLIVLEAGLWLFALRSHTFGVRLKVYIYWLNPAHWGLWFRKRRFVQSIRKISDRDLLANSSSTIEFQEQSMQSPLLKYVGNPLMKLYYLVVVKGLIWW
jgi:GT2 family glycosyltransferase